MRHQLKKLTEEYLGADQDGVAKGLLTALEHGNPGTNDYQTRPVATENAKCHNDLVSSICLVFPLHLFRPVEGSHKQDLLNHDN